MKPAIIERHRIKMHVKILNNKDIYKSIEDRFFTANRALLKKLYCLIEYEEYKAIKRKEKALKLKKIFD